jgi:hypothetical protein
MNFFRSSFVHVPFARCGESLSRIHRRQSILPSKENHLASVTGVWIHAGRTPSVRRHGTLVLPDKSRVTARAVPRTSEAGYSRLLARHRRSVHTARQPFRRGLVPGTTRKHTNGIPTALQGYRPAPANSYSGHSPRLRGLNHLADHSKAPGTNPAPIVLPALVIGFASWVTSLENCFSGPSPSVSPFRAKRSLPRARRARISGGRKGKRPLTRRCRPFAVRHRLPRSLLASPCGPLMVELFAASGFTRGRRGG